MCPPIQAGRAALVSNVFQCPRYCCCLLGPLLWVLGSASHVLQAPGRSYCLLHCYLCSPTVYLLCLFSPTLIWSTPCIKFSLLKYLAWFLFPWLTQRVKRNKVNFLFDILCIVWECWGYIHGSHMLHKAFFKKKTNQYAPIWKDIHHLLSKKNEVSNHCVYIARSHFY